MDFTKEGLAFALLDLLFCVETPEDLSGPAEIRLDENYTEERLQRILELRDMCFDQYGGRWRLWGG